MLRAWGHFYVCERYKIKNYVPTNLFFIVFVCEPFIYHIMYEDRTLSFYFHFSGLVRRKRIFLPFIDRFRCWSEVSYICDK